MMQFPHQPRHAFEPASPETTEPALPETELHVWQTRLDLPTTRIEALRKTLDRDERARAACFRFPEHQRRFIVARGILRALLARYRRTQPEDIAFAYNRYGKPFLKERDSDYRVSDPIHFNLSHAGEMALYAFARRKVGIDVEWTKRRVGDREQIANRFFSPREAAILSRLPDASKNHAFFTCWTRKEAYVKARGKGLSIPLDGFEVLSMPEGRAPGVGFQLPSTLDDTPPPNHNEARAIWTIRTFIPDTDYLAALVVEGTVEIKYRRLD
uniref:4'-phosphopantetheinyl transferase n=1 Tax=Candidatus Kentrum sp. MB TaxID=2138164 RepID=A0A450X117_9GAMM|nr:MAG: 4'-phosphopantetheinyl transferase [Candidatus Kentron sp. MB]